MDKNIIIFGVDMSSYVHIDIENKDILILDEGRTRGIDDTTLTAEAKFSVNFTQSGKRFVWSLHYNGSKSFLFVNATKMYQFKGKYSEIKDCTLCLCNVLKDFRINNMKKIGLKGTLKEFLVDYNAINTNVILNTSRYLMKET